MIHDGAVASFVADDAVLEPALVFLEAFRKTNPAMRLLLIPRSGDVARLSAFGDFYGFGVQGGDFAGIDRLEEIAFGGAPGGSGRLRWLAAFDVAASTLIHLRIAARVGDLTPLAAAMQALAAPHVGTTRLRAIRFALSGTPAGSNVVVQAVRHRLVRYLRGRLAESGTDSVLAFAISELCLNHSDMSDVAATTARVGTPQTAPKVTLLRSCDAILTTLYNGGRYRRNAGCIIGASASMAAAHQTEARRSVVEPPQAMVARFRHASVYGRGIVVTSDREIVAESLINSDAETALRMMDQPKRHHDLERPVVLLKQTWDDNYGHWLVESLPRVGLVAECYDLAECDFLIGDDAGAIGAVYRDSLALCGIGPHQIVASTDAPRFCADLIYPAPLTVQPWVKAPRVLAFLKDLAARTPARDVGARRIYVSRNRAGRRILRNEAAIVDRLRLRGYVVIEPESLDFGQQIETFRHATHIVGNLGAALANLVFSPAGVRLLALTNEFMQDDFFWDLVSQQGGGYVSLHGTSLNRAAGMAADFEVDLETLCCYLDEFESDTGALMPLSD